MITDYSDSSLKKLFPVIGGIIIALVSLFTVGLGMLGPALLLIAGIAITYLTVVITKPESGLYFLIVYCFLLFIFDREIGGIPFGTLTEVLFFVVLLAFLFNGQSLDWSSLKNDLFILMLLWLLLSVLQLANPEGGSFRGWVQEVRTSAVYPFFFVMLGFLLFSTPKHLDSFLWIIIGFSVLAALNGIRQLYFGLTPGERAFLDGGARQTHILFGQLRVFSFMRDAGQFGASQAQMALLCIILALGPYKTWKKITLACCGALFIYGMLISGTRGAFYALVSGGFLALILSKNFKVLFIGIVLTAGVFCFLKYTTIGHGSYQIRRLRTALDPNDASFNVRLMNQQKLDLYLTAKPFGGGLGVIGRWGKEYNSDKYLSTIEPDSYWVKVWAMYGIIGLIIWFSTMMYLFGKSSGMISMIKNKALRVKLIALCSSAFGLFVCSYGNEVMNALPSLMIFNLSLVFIYQGNKWSKEGL